MLTNLRGVEDMGFRWGRVGSSRDWVKKCVLG